VKIEVLREYKGQSGIDRDWSGKWDLQCEIHVYNLINVRFNSFMAKETTLDLVFHIIFYQSPRIKFCYNKHAT